MTLLEKVRLATRVNSTALDSDLEDLISAGLADLALAGVDPVDATDALTVRAVVTYVKYHFDGCTEAALKAAYDEQKAQLRTATGYTNWGGDTVV